MPRKKTALIIVAILTIGILTGWYGRMGYMRWRLKSIQAAQQPQRMLIREQNHDYTFINPVLTFELRRKENTPELKELSKKIQSYRNQAINEKYAQSISVYFRDLNSGRWTGLDEEKTYAPASMFKVFTMIAYFKLAESDPVILQKKLYYNGKIDLNELSSYSPPTSIEPNKWYTVEELIERMIIQSGNNSSALLLQNLGDEKLFSILSNIAVPYPKSKTDLEFMSPKSYSLIFRMLYNATYLTREMSEKALSLLSKTDFDKGIIAGVPQNTTVSHKFGVRTFKNLGQITNELHDCGIVYYPEKPYFICVMTKGYEFPELEKIIADLSKIAWDEMANL